MPDSVRNASAGGAATSGGAAVSSLGAQPAASDSDRSRAAVTRTTEGDGAPSTPADDRDPSAASGSDGSQGDGTSSSEAPGADIPLDGSGSMQDEGDGAPGNATEEPADDAEDDAPPADDMSPMDDVDPEGEAEPGEPEAFNPCPTDGAACRIMPLGDSITDGIDVERNYASNGGYRLALFRMAALDGHAITFVGRQANGPQNVEGQPFPRNHEGYSGATIASGGNQIANRLDAALAANTPHIVLLQIGTNDLYQGLPNNLTNQLETLIDRITDQLPNALLVVAQVTPLGGSFPNNGVQPYNAAIPNIVAERANAGEHVITVDQFTPIASRPNFVAQLVPDNIHPNDDGYAIMAEAWYEAIEPVLP
jgi:lysophospholipase L1-like esterase